MDHSPCLSINSHSNGEKLGSHHMPSIYLILQLEYTRVVVPALLIHTLVGDRCTPRGQLTCTVSFAFSVAALYHRYLGQHLSPPPSSAGLFHTFIIYLDCLFHSAYHLGNCQPPKCLFLILHTLKFTLCYKLPKVLTNMWGLFFFLGAAFLAPVVLHFTMLYLSIDF